MGMQDEAQKTFRVITAEMRAFVDDQEGSTVIEYAVIVGLIFLAIIAGVQQMAGSTSDMYNEIDTTITTAIE